MTAQDWVAIIGAVAGGLVTILGACGAVYVQVRKTHNLVNSRMSQLLELTKTSAIAEGRLAGPEE
jgi:hypothetical protein